MKTATLIRYKNRSGNYGTFGRISDAIVTGELPWRDDAKDLSCLPPAPGAPEEVYRLVLMYSPAHGRNVYHFVSMRRPDGTWGPLPDGRTNPEVHNGNLCGDILAGFGAQVLGCVLAGHHIVVFPKGSKFMSFTKDSPEKLVPIELAQDQFGVSESKDALAALEAEWGGEDVELTVCWA